MALFDLSYRAKNVYCDNTAPPHDINNWATPLVRRRGYSSCDRPFTSFAHDTGGVQSLLSVFVVVKSLATNFHSPPAVHEGLPNELQSFDGAPSSLPWVFHWHHTIHPCHDVHVHADFVYHVGCRCYSFVQRAGNSTKHWFHTVVLFVAEHRNG